MVEKYVISQTDRDKILKNYIKDGRVIIFPSKDKKKLVILQYIVDKFKSDKKYTEKEVNEVIVSMVDDYVSARRYLIEYGFMDRNNDGSEYWVKDSLTRTK